MEKTKSRARSWILIFALSFTLLALFRTPSHAQESSVAAQNAPFVVFLGTGNPGPTPNRQGPSLAVVAGGKAYLADVRRGRCPAGECSFREWGPRARSEQTGDVAFVLISTQTTRSDCPT